MYFSLAATLSSKFRRTRSCPFLQRPAATRSWFRSIADLRWSIFFPFPLHLECVCVLLCVFMAWKWRTAAAAISVRPDKKSRARPTRPGHCNHRSNSVVVCALVEQLAGSGCRLDSIFQSFPSYAACVSRQILNSYLSWELEDPSFFERKDFFQLPWISF